MATGILLVLLLMWAHLRWQPDKPWPPEPEPYIELAQEEFIEPEVIPPPASAPGNLAAAAEMPEMADEPSRTAPQSGANVSDAGAKGEPSHEVVTPKESAAKMEQKKQPAKPGPAAETKTPEKKPSAARTAVANRFEKANGKHNSDNSDADKANAGNPNGKTDSAGPASSTSSTSGIQHGKLGGGWQWPRYSNIHATAIGSIELAFTVDANGRATNIRYVGGKAPAAANARLRRECIAELQRHRFTRPASAGTPDPETDARITFIFK